MSFNNNNRQNRVNTDKFGNPNILFTATQVVSKKTGQAYEIYKGFFEQNGQLFKVEISERQKETKSGLPAKWVKVTKMRKQQQNQRF